VAVDIEREERRVAETLARHLPIVP
jgi:hypothetical protein